MERIFNILRSDGLTAMTPACQAGYPGSNPGHCIQSNDIDIISKVRIIVNLVHNAQKSAIFDVLSLHSFIIHKTKTTIILKKLIMGF